MPQDRPACLGRPPLKAPRGPPTARAKSRDLRRQSTRNGASGHHRLDGGYSGATNVGVVGARRGRLHQPETLADEVWGGKSRTTVDCRGVWRLDGQRSPTLGCLQCTDVRAPLWPRQGPLGTADRCGGDLAADAGEVCVGGYRRGGQGGLQDGTAMY